MALSTVTDRYSGRAGFGPDLVTLVRIRAGCGLLSGSGGAEGAEFGKYGKGVSQAYRWNIRCACRGRSFAWVVWPTGVAQRLRPTSTWASPRALSVARQFKGPLVMRACVTSPRCVSVRACSNGVMVWPSSNLGGRLAGVGLCGELPV